MTATALTYGHLYSPDVIVMVQGTKTKLPQTTPALITIEEIKLACLHVNVPEVDLFIYDDIDLDTAEGLKEAAMYIDHALVQSFEAKVRRNIVIGDRTRVKHWRFDAERQVLMNPQVRDSDLGNLVASQLYERLLACNPFAGTDYAYNHQFFRTTQLFPANDKLHVIYDNAKTIVTTTTTPPTEQDDPAAALRYQRAQEFITMYTNLTKYSSTSGGEESKLPTFDTKMLHYQHLRQLALLHEYFDDNYSDTKVWIQHRLEENDEEANANLSDEQKAAVALEKAHKLAQEREAAVLGLNKSSLETLTPTFTIPLIGTADDGVTTTAEIQIPLPALPPTPDAPPGGVVVPPALNRHYQKDMHVDEHKLLNDTKNFFNAHLLLPTQITGDIMVNVITGDPSFQFLLQSDFDDKNIKAKRPTDPLEGDNIAYKPTMMRMNYKNSEDVVHFEQTEHFNAALCALHAVSQEKRTSFFKARNAYFCYEGDDLMRQVYEEKYKHYECLFKQQSEHIFSTTTATEEDVNFFQFLSNDKTKKTFNYTSPQYQHTWSMNTHFAHQPITSNMLNDAASKNIIWPSLPLSAVACSHHKEHQPTNLPEHSFAAANGFVGGFVDTSDILPENAVEENPSPHNFRIIDPKHTTPPNAVSLTYHLATADHKHPIAIYSVHRSAYTTKSGEEQGEGGEAYIAKQQPHKSLNSWVNTAAKLNHHRSFFYHFAVKSRINIMSIPHGKTFYGDQFPFTGAFMAQILQNPLQNLAQVLVLDYSLKKDIPPSKYVSLLEHTTEAALAPFMSTIHPDNLKNIFHEYLFYTTTHAATIPSYVICVVNHGGVGMGYNPDVKDSTVDCNGVVRNVCTPPVEWYNYQYWHPALGQDPKIPTNDNCPPEQSIPALNFVANAQTKMMYRDLTALLKVNPYDWYYYSYHRRERFWREGQNRHRVIRCISQDLPALLEEIKHNAIAARLQLLHFMLNITMKYTPKDQIGV